MTTTKNPIDAPDCSSRNQMENGSPLKQFGMNVGEGLITDMRAIRKDYFLDHDHSAYVDQWGLGTGHHRRTAQPATLKTGGGKDMESPQGREKPNCKTLFPQLKTDKYPDMPEKNSPLSTRKTSWPNTPDMPPQTARNGNRQGAQSGSSFMASAGPLRMVTPMKCGPRIMTDWATETTSEDGPLHAWPERRHPWSGTPITKTPPRIDLHGRSRQRPNPAATA